MSATHIVTRKIKEAERALRGVYLSPEQYMAALAAHTELGVSLRVAAESYQPGGDFPAEWCQSRFTTGQTTYQCGLKAHSEETDHEWPGAYFHKPPASAVPQQVTWEDKAADPQEPKVLSINPDGGIKAYESHDPVNHPSHYTSGGIEVIDAIEAWGLHANFCLGNVVKYVARAGKKGDLVEDLKKAHWYLDREISRLEGS